jgi:glycosidase
MRIPALAWVLHSTLLIAAPPTVAKVEPPNWWLGYSINPVRLLVHGAGLRGAAVETGSATIHASNVHINESGTYLFVDLTIPRTAKPGRIDLKIQTAEGVSAAPFEILAPLSRAGRFQGFSSRDLIYLIMPDRFSDGDPSNNDPPGSKGLFDRSKPRYYHGGDLQGVIDHLRYLKDLGVTAIWLNPIYDNVNHLNTREIYDGKPITDYHGYGATDFYAVDEHLGTIAKFRELADAAHRLGIKMIQDQVANHTGPFHPWVTDPPTPTWYHGTAAQHITETWQTWTLMDPHARPELRKATLDGWFLDILPDLNQDDPEVARYLIQNTLWWVGISGLDGIRQDTLPYVPRSFWRKWMAAIKTEYPNLRVVGEMFDGDPGLVSFFQGGAKRYDGIDSGIDSLFDFPLFYQLRRAFGSGTSIRDVPKMLGHDWMYPNPRMLVTFLGLHDVPRFMNEPGASVEGLKLAFTLLLTTRGIPMIYYGDEIAMRGGNDPDNRRDFPGGFPGDSRNAFAEPGRTQEEQSVFARVRSLAHLRASCDSLQTGRLVQLLADEQTYAYARTGGSCTAVVVMNNSTREGRFVVPLAGIKMTGDAIHDAMGGRDARHTGGTLTVELAPRTAAVYVTR